MAAMDLGGSSHSSGSQRPTAEESLSENPQTFRREEGTCGGGSQAGGDLLEATDQLGGPTCSCGSVIEDRKHAHLLGERDPILGLASFGCAAVVIRCLADT